MTTAEIDFGWHREPSGTQARLSWRETQRGMGELYLFHPHGSDEHLVYATAPEARAFADGLPEDSTVAEVLQARDATWAF